MKFTSVILFVTCFYFASGTGNYDFPSAPIIPLAQPVDVLVKPAGHDKGVEEHKADTDHDSAYKFQEISHSNPIDGSEKIVKEEAQDDTKDSQYNLVATDRELIPGVKESSISEDSQDKDHSSYYKFAAYDLQTPALYRTYYPAYIPALPMVSSHGYGAGYGGANIGGYGGANIGGYGGANIGGYGGANIGGYGDINLGGYGGANLGGYGGLNLGGYGAGNIDGVYGGYGSPFNGMGNVLGGLGYSLGGRGNSLYGLGNSLGGNYNSDNSYGGYGNLKKDIQIPDLDFPSMNYIPSQSSLKYKPTSHNTMKKVNFDQSYDGPSYK